MIRLGIFSFVASALQLIVPSYGLRLVRRFGTKNVGWFLVAAFASLAVMHFLEPWRAPAVGSGSSVSLDVLYAIGSVLLLIGMGHIETLFGERLQAEKNGERLQSRWQSRVQEESRSKQELLQEIACLERKEKALRESEAQYRFLFFENPQPMWIHDLRSFRFLSVNKAALRQYGFSQEEFMARHPQDLISSESAAAFQKDLAKPCLSIEPRGLWRHFRKDRVPIDVEITAVDLKYGDIPSRLVMATDVSIHRRREQETLEMQKMETIGQVAAGAANHFNNLLTIIDGHANLLLRKPQDSPTQEQLKHISTAANRAAGFTRQLLAVGGRHFLQKEALDLNHLVRNRYQMLRRLIGDSLDFQTSLYPHLTQIIADPHLVEHILVNLVLNSRDAMPTGGTLTISTASARVDEAQARRQQRVAPGEYVCLSVQDTGCGMTPDVQARVFEPFFTTHDTGKATGLGLASVYGAIRQHAGWVEFTTEEGTGTEFRVFFPCASLSQIATQKKVQPIAPSVRETVLLVEAKERVRGLARFVLERQGYRIIEAENGPTALFFWESQGATIDLLLTDLNLPGEVSGVDLAERMRKTKPDLKVVYTADPGTKTDGEQPTSLDGVQFVPKPFSPDRLLQALEAALSEQA
jgi:two-component system cell cycle sensor histidine kinase/response regulator CckA